MHDQIYARIEHDEVVQFPMSVNDINTRDNPTDVYFPCFYKAHFPIVPVKLSEKIIETPWILGNVVYIEEYRTTKTVEELFAYLATVAVSFNELGQPYIDRNLITPEIFAAFEEVVKIKVQGILDEFARTRGYDDMKSVCTYSTSSNPTYQTEALRAIELRDTTWSTLYVYFYDIMANTAPVPTSWEDIAAMLPTLVWEVAP